MFDDTGRDDATDLSDCQVVGKPGKKPAGKLESLVRRPCVDHSLRVSGLAIRGVVDH